VEKNEISLPKNKEKCIPQLHDFRQREQPPPEHRVAAHIIPTKIQTHHLIFPLGP
jgi:hypothetical protein